jgi:hypothetical protein
VRPLAVDLCTGLHGWAEGLVVEGWRVRGYDIVDMCELVGDPRPDHVELVLKSILDLHGSEVADAELIVASPPCQFFSYTAMPWTIAKARAAATRADPELLAKELALFNACFRIQREASEAAGRQIPMVLENVRGAEPWVGRAKWSVGAYYLWGDVPALMPAEKHIKVKGFRFDGVTKRCFQETALRHMRDGRGHTRHLTNPAEHFDSGARLNRKAATASISKIPAPIARWIGRVYFPETSRQITDAGAPSTDCAAIGSELDGASRPSSQGS